VKNGNILFPPYEDMEKCGLTGPYNKVYFVNSNGIAASYIISSENYDIINQYMNQ